MSSVVSTIFYVLVFMSVYVQIFFLVTFFENRKKLAIRKGLVKLKNYPKVTIIVPCWNEENTIYKTVRSILSLSYPKDKMELFLIDDGSTDNTWKVISQFESYKNVKIFHKENGGKHTAVNWGIERASGEFIGCLDADSFVDKHALVRIISYFEKDDKVMAVAPSIIVYEPKTIIQKAQTVDYQMSVYIKKMLGLMGAIHVAPGPFTFFRKEVFDKIGKFRPAHNTEDMEIAYRMQTNFMKIQQCHDAYVYTNTPNTLKKLFKQRLRWIYGFLNNTLDYKDALFKKKYGNFAFFTVPAGIVSVVTVVYLLGRILHRIGEFIHDQYVEYQMVGIDLTPGKIELDPFFINTQMLMLLSVAIYSLVIMSVIIGRKIILEKNNFPRDMIYFLVVFSVFAPAWILKAIYKTVVAQKPAWR